MVKTLPEALTIEIAKEAHSFCHLIKLELSSTYYWTDCDQDIYYSSQWWTAKPIEFDQAKYSLLPKVDSLNLRIDNVDKTFSTLILSQDIRGKKCTIYRTLLDNNLAVIGAAVILFMGYVDAIECDVRTASIELYNHFIKWKTPTPRRIHSPLCPWTFKDTETCHYTGGETWCDRSWDRCLNLINTINFGGFRWLPYITDKPIWWGRTPK